jgi:hypothetical protein
MIGAGLLLGAVLGLGALIAAGSGPRRAPRPVRVRTDERR